MNLTSSPNELLYVGFNQDNGCFACGTDTGFRIYNCNPFRETFRRDFSSGGIGLVEMLFRCNILALVGGGRNPRYPPDKVMIWDDHQNRCIGELSFRSEVKAVKLRRDRVVVVLQNKIYVYNFADLKLIDHIETVNNPKGLCAVSPSTTNTVLACPALHRGHVRVELYDIRKTTFIAAHETDLACMALNMAGTRLATASEKGTLLRIYDTSSGDMLQELRRGADRADIYCICFNPATNRVACSSDKGTVHIFKLEKGADDAAGGGSDGKAAATTSSAAAGGATGAGGGKAATASTASSSSGSAATGAGAKAGGGASGAGGSTSGAAVTAAAGGGGAGGGAGVGGAAAAGGGGAAVAGTGAGSKGKGDDKATKPAKEENPRSRLSFMKGLLPSYFASEWSFAQFRVPEVKTICAFGAEPNTIIVVGADGSFSKANFEGGGEATRTSYSRFIKADTVDDD